MGGEIQAGPEEGSVSSLNHSTAQKAFQEVPGDAVYLCTEGQRGTEPGAEPRVRSGAQSPAGGSSSSLRRRALDTAPTH